MKYDVVYISHLGRIIMESYEDIDIANNRCAYLNKNHAGVGHYKVNPGASTENR